LRLFFSWAFFVLLRVFPSESLSLVVRRLFRIDAVVEVSAFVCFAVPFHPHTIPPLRVAARYYAVAQRASW
jgi:hypothetical protein